MWGRLTVWRGWHRLPVIDGMEDRNTRTNDALTLDVDVPAQG